jgi:hypothetical protein
MADLVARFEPGLVIVLGVYIAVYGSLLLSTSGLPYVMDNNESFSALLHAQNMHLFGWGESYWLTDEAASPSAAAHPFLHTHQGNVPRLVAYILYRAGATTIELQIIWTTFTIGIAATLLAYFFFKNIANSLLATLFCIVLHTDFLLWTQWNVNTYRIWYFFLLFAALQSSVCAATGRKVWWSVLTVAVYALVYYFELVFAAFLSFSVAMFTAYFHRAQPKLVIRAWCTQLAGAFLGIGVLLTQLSAYMGWENVVQDFQYTFNARNMAILDSKAIESVIEFYGEHNIAFFHNFLDASGLLTLSEFWSGIFEFGFFLHSPPLTGIYFILFIAWCCLPGRHDDRPVPSVSRLAMSTIIISSLAPFSLILRQNSGLLAIITLGFAVAVISLLKARSTGQRKDHLVLRRDGEIARSLSRFSYFVLVPPLFLSFMLLIFSEGMLGARNSTTLGVLGSATWMFIALLFALIFARRVCDIRVAPSIALLRLPRVIRAALFVNLTFALMHFLQHLYREQTGVVWSLNSLDGVWTGSTIRVALVAMILSGTWLIVRNPWMGRVSATGTSIRSNVLAYLLCSLIAFAIVYRLSPGYVYSGYLWRLSPFIVFFIDLIPAIAAYVVIEMFRGRRYLRTLSSGKRDASISWSRALESPIAVGLLLVLTIGWGYANIHVSRLVSLEATSFLKILSEQPAKSPGIAVSTYAIPMHLVAGTWAYLDAAIGFGRIISDEKGLRFEGNYDYVWFADAESNEDYRRPGRYVCFIPPSSYPDLVLSIQNAERTRRGRCSTLPLVKWAMERRSGLTLVARDIDDDRWAIVEISYPLSRDLLKRSE